MVIDWRVTGRDGSELHLAFDYGAAYSLLGSILVDGRVSGPGFHAEFRTATHYALLRKFLSNLSMGLGNPQRVELELDDTAIHDNNLNFDGWEETRLCLEADQLSGYAAGTAIVASSYQHCHTKVEFRFALPDDGLRSAFYDLQSVVDSFPEPTGVED